MERTTRSRLAIRPFELAMTAQANVWRELLVAEPLDKERSMDDAMDRAERASIRESVEVTVAKLI